jgi:outer membrane protein assembly factor BamB
MVESDAGKVTLATACGGVFQWDGHAAAAEAVQAAPWPPPGPSGPATAVTRSGSTLALSCGPGSDEVLTVDLADPGRPPHAWRLPGALACRPIAWSGGLLAPSTVGQVFFLDPRTGANRSAPFQPRLQSGSLPAWREPVAVGDGEVVIADGHWKLYCLHVADTPAPHLAARAEVELTEPIVSPLAAVGKVVCGVDAGGKIDFFQLPGLKPAGQQELPGRCAWGPCTVGDAVMLATDRGQLCCFDAPGKPRWQTPLRYGPLAGKPLAVADHYLLAAAGGVVWRADGKTGKELGNVDVAAPLATGPVLLGNRLLLGGYDGSLHSIAPP